MREVTASEARTHLSHLLDEVERGATVIITRNGRRIARLVPEPNVRQEEIESALEGIRAIRRRTGKISIQELLSARNDGLK